jgi:5'-nucleotidase
MKILLTNDDGVNAEGIKHLLDAFKDAHELYVVAPETERSGAGMSVTIHKPIKVAKTELDGAQLSYSVAGTPVDCVKLAVKALLPSRPGAVISGINPGSNIGINILYSGTAAAVLEAMFQGIPGMAVSMPAHGGPGYEYTARFARYLFERVFIGNPIGAAGLNVNMPVASADEIKGIAVTRQCSGGIVERYELVDESGVQAYILKGFVYCESGASKLDTAAVSSGWISITPIRPDVSHSDVEMLVRKLDFSDWKRD